jgi:hypothetical protein
VARAGVKMAARSNGRKLKRMKCLAIICALASQF